MVQPRPRFVAAAAALSLFTLLGSSREAKANGFHTLTVEPEQFARGGAWLARANNPLATFFNPAALSRNASGASVSMNLIFQRTCFQRKGPDNSVAADASATASYGEVCNEGNPFPNPQLAGNFRITDKLGVGIAVLGPSAAGKDKYSLTGTNKRLTDSFVTDAKAGDPSVGPSGTRFLLTDIDPLIAWPQIGVGYEAMPNLRFGASFIWGIAVLKFGNVAFGTGPTDQFKDGYFQEPASLNLKAILESKDLFVPGFVLSTMYSPTKNIDLAAWYHWSDSVRASGQADVTGVVYNNSDVNPNPRSNPTPDGKTSVTVPQPMEARIGFRFFVPRNTAEPAPDAPAKRVVKDPLHDEVFDVELDGEWSHDSQFDDLLIRFNAKPPTAVIPSGSNTALGVVPANADTPHRWKDSFGLRLGGDFNAIRDLLAVRAGVWYQTSSIDPRYLHVDYVPSQRVALAAGATVRVSIVDIQAGFAHTFFQSVDNNGNGWIKGLTPVESQGYRSPYAVNGGRVSAHSNIISFGAVARW